MTQLKECPFSACEGVGVMNMDSNRPLYRKESVRVYNVSCTHCDTTGPTAGTADEAADHWNERTRTDTDAEPFEKSPEFILRNKVTAVYTVLDIVAPDLDQSREGRLKWLIEAARKELEDLIEQSKKWKHK